MNILYLNNEMTIGGVAKCILKLSKEFIRSNTIFIASKDGGALLPEFEKIGIRNISLNDIENKTPYNIISNIIKIIYIVKKNNIDIIHSHHRMTTLLAKIVSKFIGVRVIHTQHLCIEDKFKLTNVSLKNVNTITVSEAAKRILIRKSKLDEKNIITVYNTIETECKNKVVDSELLELKKCGYFIVAQVSRMIDYKGVYDFIEVAKRTSLENEKIKFVLLGDGPELDNLKKLVKKEGLKEIVYLLGSKDNVIEHLKYIDVLLLCSYIEGLPLAPLEAFSQGVPVIATNIDGTNEEIIDGINGYLVNVKDIEMFKKFILELYGNKAKYIDMSEKCKKVFKDKFNNNLYFDLHLKIYKNNM
ncbi:glycosyltransferase family 4 protein [Candidatus Clostridium helianthi]|uniref:Glycosyltransferase family 4 protein n=1 Tax=Candidatus Clostridium helianthi TaxID=3381660 RepID=A0ABW8RY72_9CLOT